MLEECNQYLKGELLTVKSDLESFTKHLQHRIETLQVGASSESRHTILPSFQYFCFSKAHYVLATCL